MKKLLTRGLVLLFMLSSSWVIAAITDLKGGPSNENNAFTITNCDFPYYHQYATSSESDSIAWEVLEGSAEFISTNNLLTINDATDSTILLKTVYSNANFTIETYVVNVEGDCSNENNVFTITNCDFPYYHQYAISSGSDSIVWKVLEGSAEFISTNNLLTINDATDSTILLKTVYNNANFTIETYMVNVEGDCLKEIISQDTISIENCNFPYTHNIVTIAVSQTITYELESGAVDFTYSDASPLIINDAKDGSVLVQKIILDSDSSTVYITKYLVNVKGNCDNGKYTLEGHVTAQQEKWQHGMIYLYDMSQDMFVDSVEFNNGIYLFTNVSAGTYTVYTVPYQDSTLTKPVIGFIPTYYVNKMTIDDANTFEITDDTFSVDVSLIPATTVSLNDFNEVTVSIYPNPFLNELIIDLNEIEGEVKISTIQGNVVYNGVLDQTTSLNTVDWTSGVYVVEVQTQNSVKRFTVIK